MSPAFSTALLEGVIRDSLVGCFINDNEVDMIKEKAWALIASKPGEKLRMLDLRGNGCFNLRAPTDAVRASDHTAGWELGRSIYHGHEYVDGIIFFSRINGGDVYVVFDRAISKLYVLDTGLLSTHPELKATLMEEFMGVKK